MIADWHPRYRFRAILRHVIAAFFLITKTYHFGCNIVIMLCVYTHMLIIILIITFMVISSHLTITCAYSFLDVRSLILSVSVRRHPITQLLTNNKIAKRKLIYHRKRLKGCEKSINTKKSGKDGKIRSEKWSSSCCSMWLNECRFSSAYMFK